MRKMIITALLTTIALLGAKTYNLVSEPYPPYEYQDNGKNLGMDVEILEAVAKSAGVEFKISFLPWKRALSEVQDGSSDAIFSILHNTERDAFLFYPDKPLFKGKTVIFANDNFKGEIKTVGDLNGKKVGFVSGNSYGKEFDNASEILKDPSTNVEMSVKKLLNNRHDLLIATEEVGWFYLKKSKAKNVRVLPLAVMEEDYFIATSKKSPNGKELQNLLNEHLLKLEKDKVLDAIRAKYRDK